ncbi:MAG: phosphatidylglycerol lysyltransferase domain-containing protein [Eubacteriales bacterium]
MNIIWKDIEFKDKDVIDAYYQYEQSRSCEYTFTNNLLWAPFYRVRYTIIEDMLVFMSDEVKFSASFPLAKSEDSAKNTKKVLLLLQEYFEENKKPFKLHLVSEKKFDLLEELFPGEFEIEYDRDAADYVYDSEKLISLSGKKLHGKRNHINKFKENFPEWKYEAISDDNVDECRAMAKEWKKQNLCDELDDKHKEFCVTMNALKLYKELGIKGGLLRANENVVAFTLGEECSKDTFVVHIEKAFADVQGAYPMINQQFILHEASQYQYINREEDTGAEGLRKAKLSYYPVFLQEKGIVTKK